MEQRRAYPTDLTDTQWARIEPLLPKRRNRRGAPNRHSRRELLNAVAYVTRNGTIWAALPHDFPPYKTVYDFYRKLCRRGAWEPILDALREQARVQMKRKAHPSIIVIDSQSVKTTEKGGLAAMMHTSG